MEQRTSGCITVLTIVFGATILAVNLSTCRGQTYAEVKAIIDDKLNSSVYASDVRPPIDQSQVLNVTMGFELIAIIELDDVGQKFICNGFLTAQWTDELVAWTPSSYGNQTIIHPTITKMWKPRMVLLNTINKRDLFEDDHAPLTVAYDGSVAWIPGSVFPSSCDMVMTKFPFDTQNCSIYFLVMNAVADEVDLIASSSTVGQSYYVISGEWELARTELVVVYMSFEESANPRYTAGIRISFLLKRRPYTLLINIVLPVVFVSFLNILVFAIPVDSGERIGYGITVLLSLTVYLSAVSSMLPSASTTVPLLTIYLFCLLVEGVLSVVTTIIIVYLHNKEVKDDKAIKAREDFACGIKKVKTLNNAVAPFDSNKPGFSPSRPTSAQSLGHQKHAPKEDRPEKNKYRLIGRHIDRVSFGLFFTVWLAFTAGFLGAMSN